MLLAQIFELRVPGPPDRKYTPSYNWLFSLQDNNF